MYCSSGRVKHNFTHRESDDPKAFCASRATGLVEMVTNAIHEKCRIVNQVPKFKCEFVTQIVVVEMRCL